MNYLGNGRFEIYTASGDIIQFNEDDFDEIVKEMQAAIGNKSKVGNHIEQTPFNNVYEDSAKFSLLKTEIRDSAYKEVQYSSELDTILEETIDASLIAATEYYEDNYHMVAK